MDIWEVISSSGQCLSRLKNSVLQLVWGDRDYHVDLEGSAHSQGMLLSPSSARRGKVNRWTLVVLFRVWNEGICAVFSTWKTFYGLEIQSTEMKHQDALWFLSHMLPCSLKTVIVVLWADIDFMIAANNEVFPANITCSRSRRFFFSK